MWRRWTSATPPSSWSPDHNQTQSRRGRAPGLVLWRLLKYAWSKSLIGIYISLSPKFWINSGRNYQFAKFTPRITLDDQDYLARVKVKPFCKEESSVHNWVDAHEHCHLSHKSERLWEQGRELERIQLRHILLSVNVWNWNFLMIPKMRNSPWLQTTVVTWPWLLCSPV